MTVQAPTFEQFLVLDFETTGNHPNRGDRIIQIGAVVFEGGRVTDRYSTLVHPGCSIPAFISNLTGITDEMVEGAPLLEEVLPTLLKLVDGKVLVAHNALFDLSFLNEALLEQGYHPYSGSVIDTVELARILLPSAESYRLSDLASFLGMEHDRPHQADSDAETTAYLLQYLLAKLDLLPLVTIQRLIPLSKHFASDIEELLKNREQQLLKTARPYDQEADSYDVYRHLALRHRDVTFEHDEEITGDFPGESFEQFRETLFGEGGLLQREFPQFEKRSAQLEMMNQVYQAFEGSTHLMVEAGTGTGKSWAYLLPSLYWASQTGQKVVISTNTIQLQEQLFQRDVPLISRIWPDHPRVELMKGRGNYLCLRKFEQSIEGTDSFKEDGESALIKSQMLVWLTETESGDWEELNMSQSGKRFWYQVQSDANSCLNRHCPWFSRCFYHRSRQHTQDADVIITNHSLLFTDLRSEHNILPSYQYAVIDEAHHLEESASYHLGKSLNAVQLDILLKTFAGNQGSGLLFRLMQAVQEWDGTIYSRLSAHVDPIFQQWEKARRAVRELFTVLMEWVRQTSGQSTFAEKREIRYHPNDWGHSWNEPIRSAAQNAVDELIFLARELEHVYNSLIVEEIPFTARALVIDWNGAMKNIQYYAEMIYELILDHHEDGVYWMETDGNRSRNGIQLYQVPVDVSIMLREEFFEKKESVVLTSATISVNQSFDYPLSRLGLSDLYQQGLVSTGVLPSPFQYKKQTLLCIPTDFPNIKGISESEYSKYLVGSLGELAETTNGRMLVLFTSYQMLRQVYEPLKERLSSSDIRVLGHGIDSSSRSILLKHFKNSEKSVLLGTSSFWEGVDIPGKDLSCLVITKLPFSPPNHPVTEARSERLRQMGKNPFLSLSVPQAVIRFKQGFGRLVRSREDKGVVVIFDRRIVEARYGGQFLRSLPEPAMIQRPFTEILEEIKNWLG